MLTHHKFSCAMFFSKKMKTKQNTTISFSKKTKHTTYKFIFKNNKREMFIKRNDNKTKIRISKKYTCSTSKSRSKYEIKKWLTVLKIILTIISFLASPITDRVKDHFFEVSGINGLIEETGIYSYIDNLFGINEEMSNNETIF